MNNRLSLANTHLQRDDGRRFMSDSSAGKKEEEPKPRRPNDELEIILRLQAAEMSPEIAEI